LKYYKMKTDKNQIRLLVKSKPKVSTLEITRNLKPETTIRPWKTQKENLKKYYWKELHYGLRDISRLLSQR